MSNIILGVTAVNTTDVLWAAIVSWNHPDGVVRIQNRRNAPPLNFIDWGTKERVTCCASIPDCRLLFFGSTSGVISVFNSKFNADKVNIILCLFQPTCMGLVKNSFGKLIGLGFVKSGVSIFLPDKNRYSSSLLISVPPNLRFICVAVPQT